MVCVTLPYAAIGRCIFLRFVVLLQFALLHGDPGHALSVSSRMSSELLRPGLTSSHCASSRTPVQASPTSPISPLPHRLPNSSQSSHASIQPSPLTLLLPDLMTPITTPLLLLSHPSHRALPLASPLPLLRCIALGRPSVDGLDLLLQRPVHKPVPRQRRLLLELRRHDVRGEHLAAAACVGRSER